MGGVNTKHWGQFAIVVKGSQWPFAAGYLPPILLGGGFIYIGKGNQVVGLNELVPMSMRTPNIVHFGMPRTEIPNDALKILRTRRQPVLVDFHKAQGARYFAFVTPSEKIGDTFQDDGHGGFVYMFASKSSRTDCYFPILDEE